jgi:glycosyltransferase involved in cell wall biosynthesis
MKKGINCEIIPYPDYKEMGKKLFELMKNPEQAKRLAEAARAEALEFSKTDFRNDRIQTIDELMELNKLPAWRRARADS